MRKTIKSLFAVAVVGVMAQVAVVKAAVILADNISPVTSGQTTVTITDTKMIDSTTSWGAQSFATTTASLLEDIDLSVYSNGFVTEGNLVVSVFTSSSGLPGTEVSGSAISIAYSSGKITDIGGTILSLKNVNIQLNQNTEYFLVAKANSFDQSSIDLGGAFGWTRTSQTSGTVGFPSTVALWDNAGGWTSGLNTDPQFQMSITAVPEPATTAAAVSGLLAAFAMLRRPSVRAKLGALIGR